jgi:hypothetical protein
LRSSITPSRATSRCALNGCADCESLDARLSASTQRCYQAGVHSGRSTSCSTPGVEIERPHGGDKLDVDPRVDAAPQLDIKAAPGAGARCGATHRWRSRQVARSRRTGCSCGRSLRRRPSPPVSTVARDAFVSQHTRASRG